MADEDKDKPKKEIVKTNSSLVFISHDTRDAKLAEAFSALLKSVSAGVLKSFRTSDKKGAKELSMESNGIQKSLRIFRKLLMLFVSSRRETSIDLGFYLKQEWRKENLEPLF